MSIIEQIVARARQDNWSDSIATAIALDARITSPADVDRAFFEANEIRALIALADKRMRSMGYDTTGAAEQFVATRFSRQQVGESIQNLYAEHDEKIHISNIRSAKDESGEAVASQINKAFAEELWATIRARQQQQQKESEQ